MGSCICQNKYQLHIMLFPNKQPIRLNMTFPESFPFARQFMWSIFRWQRSRFGKQGDYLFEQGLVATTFQALLV